MALTSTFTPFFSGLFDAFSAGSFVAAVLSPANLSFSFCPFGRGITGGASRHTAAILHRRGFQRGLAGNFLPLRRRDNLIAGLEWRRRLFHVFRRGGCGEMGFDGGRRRRMVIHRRRLWRSARKFALQKKKFHAQLYPHYFHNTTLWPIHVLNHFWYIWKGRGTLCFHQHFKGHFLR